MEQLLALRTHQRLDAWRTLHEVWLTYQQGLLVQAEATAVSTLGQYRVGKVPFASVLEANAAALAEADGAIQVLADGWRLAIAQDELSLADVSVENPNVSSGSSMTSPTTLDTGASAEGTGMKP